jgi:hypothetical protein
MHFDRWWNPAIERQAEDRTHRIGQTKNVFVTRLICQDTIEERIERLLTRKQSLFEEVIDELADVNLERILSEEELFALFDLTPPKRSGRPGAEQVRSQPGSATTESDTDSNTNNSPSEFPDHPLEKFHGTEVTREIPSVEMPYYDVSAQKLQINVKRDIDLVELLQDTFSDLDESEIEDLLDDGRVTIRGETAFYGWKAYQGESVEIQVMNRGRPPLRN